MNKIKAPWTEEQVRVLKWWQEDEPFHSYTCLNRGDGGHPEGSKLVPTTQGWICEYCSFTQEWAWFFLNRL